MNDHDPVDLAAIAIPVLIEAVAVTFMIGCAMLLVVIFSGRI